MACVDLDANTIIKVGPGGWKNSNDSEWDAKGISNITRIFISFGISHTMDRINSLQFEYIEDGKTKLSSVYGSNHPRAGFNFETVVFEEGEYITRLSGTAIGFDDDKRVTSLTFETNIDSYGPFGGKGFEKFTFGFGRGNNFAGFFGSCSSAGLSSIGCYVNLNMN